MIHEFKYNNFSDKKNKNIQKNVDKDYENS